MKERTMEAVRSGAALLDEREPGWRDRIAPMDLAMDACHTCVIGHVWGLTNVEEWQLVLDRYDRALETLGIPSDRRDHRRSSRSAAYGFIPTDGESWVGLRDAWIGFIKEEWS